MSRKPATVASLARRTQSDYDDVLLTLWDAGIRYPSGPQSIVRTADIPKAERALELASPKEKMQVDYWIHLTGASREVLSSELASYGISLGPNARRIPKGSLARLEKYLRGKGATATKQASTARQETKAAVELVPFRWQVVGHRRELQYLTTPEVEGIHFAIAEDFASSPDPISPAGIRSQNLLESATSRPHSGMGDDRKYPTAELAGAALMHSLVHNHAFYNGNKRTALVSLLSFLDRNGVMLTCDQRELFRWTIRVAQHGVAPSNLSGDRHDIEVVEMAKWIRANSRSIDKSERVVTWVVLRRRLRELGCDVQPMPNRGGRMMVSRNVQTTTKTLLGGSRQVTRLAKYSVAYGGDGRQVGRSVIKDLRQQLQLSEEHGFDSEAFYGSSTAPVDEFIRIYRKTLARLAKL